MDVFTHVYEVKKKIKKFSKKVLTISRFSATKEVTKNEIRR